VLRGAVGDTFGVVAQNLSVMAGTCHDSSAVIAAAELCLQRACWRRVRLVSSVHHILLGHQLPEAHELKIISVRMQQHVLRILAAVCCCGHGKASTYLEDSLPSNTAGPYLLSCIVLLVNLQLVTSLPSSTTGAWRCWLLGQRLWWLSVDTCR
jgi:hypothetical protein